MKPLRVLLAGCGYVGTALGTSLVRGGHEVIALRRRPEGLPVEFRTLAADLTEPGLESRLPGRLDFAVFSASARETTDDAYRRTYVDGLSNLLRSLEGQRGLRRVYFTSSTAVYAQTDGSWVDEDSETLPRHFAGVRTLEAEAIAEQSSIPTTVLRCSGIYGPGRTRLVTALRDGTARLPAEDHFTNRIHRDDLARVIEWLMLHAAAPARLVVSDDEPVALSSMIRQLAAELGVEVPPRESVGPSRQRGGNKRCSNRRLRDLGFVLRYPTFREGYGSLLQKT